MFLNANHITTYQWQIDTGFGFQNVNDIANFNGSNTNTLIVSIPFESIDGAKYRLNYTDECGFTSTSNEYSSRISEPDPVEGIDDVIFCELDIEIVEVDYDGTNYIWNDENATVGRFIEPKVAGEYIVQFLQNSSSCLAYDTIIVTIEDCLAKCIVTAPTGFSPDLSGFNDQFRAIYTCSLDYFEMMIVNRWGEKVFYTENPSQAWDGMFKNLPAPVGTYTWYIKYNKEGENKQQSVSGNVTLIR